jgi:hypothetical protein
MQLKSVVFPAPLGPIMAKMLPCFTSKEISKRAWRPPKEMERLPTSKNDIGYPEKPAGYQNGLAVVLPLTLPSPARGEGK